MTTKLTGGMLDTLIALVEEGPLWAGDVPSKVGRDRLIAEDLAVPILVKGEEGHTAANYKGRDAYKAHYSPRPDGSNCATIDEAKAERIRRRNARANEQV